MSFIEINNRDAHNVLFPSYTVKNYEMHPLRRLFKNCQNTLYAMKFTLYQEAIHLAKTLNEQLDHVVILKSQTLLIFSDLN